MSHYVYTALDTDGDPLYVGSTNDVATRMNNHGLYAPWAPFVARVEVVACEDKTEALDTERLLIADLEPTFNRMSNPLYAPEPYEVDGMESQESRRQFAHDHMEAELARLFDADVIDQIAARSNGKKPEKAA